MVAKNLDCFDKFHNCWFMKGPKTIKPCRNFMEILHKPKDPVVLNFDQVYYYLQST